MNNQRPTMKDVPIGILRPNEEANTIEVWTGTEWKTATQEVFDDLRKAQEK